MYIVAVVVAVHKGHDILEKVERAIDTRAELAGPSDIGHRQGLKHQRTQIGLIRKVVVVRHAGKAVRGGNEHRVVTFVQRSEKAHLDQGSRRVAEIEQVRARHNRGRRP